MWRRGHAIAVVLITACRISDLSFHLPGDAGDAPPPDAGPPPSCVDLPAMCGAAGDSCCTSLAVPGGSFYRDYDAANDVRSGRKTNPATISDFRLDRYDVTVGRFRRFVTAGMGTQLQPPTQDAGAHPHRTGSGWDTRWNTLLQPNTPELRAHLQGCVYCTWHDLPGSTDDENRPMNYITWYEAMAFCIWDGGYLPTEAEWNYAALGGDQQRAYPWSSPADPLTIDASYASYAPGGGNNCRGDGMPGCAVTDLVPVGTLPKGDGRWGHADLAGNVSRWLLDWSAPYDPTCMDCIDLVMPPGSCPDSCPPRAMRGGAFVYDNDKLRGIDRPNGYPEMRNYIHGFRCARPM